MSLFHQAIPTRASAGGTALHGRRLHDEKMAVGIIVAEPARVRDRLDEAQEIDRAGDGGGAFQGAQDTALRSP